MILKTPQEAFSTIGQALEIALAQGAYKNLATVQQINQALAIFQTMLPPENESDKITNRAEQRKKPKQPEPVEN